MLYSEFVLKNWENLFIIIIIIII